MTYQSDFNKVELTDDANTVLREDSTNGMIIEALLVAVSEVK